ncbi:HEWD family protein [Halomarina halobia]|uniref:HEWD family protein n=1 Tax=Halomarina halobia TaxID=3033386 RepID=A0ABD6A676_9EURY|nr:HEWD family protein [Halomarina sp. PSR21]
MATIVPPTERTCERCGRHDVWDATSENWVVRDEVGNPHCLHEWDISGKYNPVGE